MKTRKTLLTVVMILGAATFAGAQDRLADQLRKGIVQEEVNQNLTKAIEAYQAIVAQFDEERKTAASALYRLAECSRKAGKRDQAIAAYQRVVREFADQAALVESSRKQLTTAFGSTVAAAAERARTGGGAVAAREKAIESLQREKAALEARRVAIEQRIKEGVISRESKEYQQLVQEIDQATRQLAVTAAKQTSNSMVASRQQLEAASRQIEAAGANKISSDSLETLRQRLEQLSLGRWTGSPEETRLEMQAMEQRFADQRKKLEVGLVTQESVQALQAELQLLRLRYQQQLTQREAEKNAEREAQLMTQRMMKSIQAEIALIQERLTAKEKSAPPGTILSQSDPELLQLRRDLLSLQRKLDELRTGLKR